MRGSTSLVVADRCQVQIGDPEPAVAPARSVDKAAALTPSVVPNGFRRQNGGKAMAYALESRCVLALPAPTCWHARALVPNLAMRAPAATAARNVPDATIAEFRRAGILRVCSRCGSADIRNPSAYFFGSSTRWPRDARRAPGFTGCSVNCNGSSHCFRNAGRTTSGAMHRRQWRRAASCHEPWLAEARTDGG